MSAPPQMPLAALLETALGNGRSVPTADAGFPVLRSNAVSNGRVNLRERKMGAWTAEEGLRFAVSSGDLLFVRGSGSKRQVGQAAIVGDVTDSVAYPDTLIRGRLREELVDHRYFLHAWNGPIGRDQLETAARTTAGIYKVNQTDLGRVAIPVPPLDEQRRIVAVLEDHLSRLDAADAYLAAALRRGQRLSEAVLRRQVAALDARAVPVAQLLAAPLANGRSVPDQPDGFPVLRLTSLRDGWIDRSQHKKGRWSRDAALPHLIRDGDFLIARGNGSLALVGRGGLVAGSGIEVAYPDTLIRLRPATDLLLPEYLRLVWHTRVIREQIERQARTTAGIYKINQQMIGSIEVPVPSLADQRAVVNEMASADAEAQRLIASASETRRRVGGLRRALLTAAFTGRLTNRSSDMDVAEELAEAAS